MSVRARLLAAGRRRPRATGLALLAPGTLWLLLFALLPFALVVVASLLPRGTYGGVEPGFTLEHYRRLLDPLYLQVFARTLLWAALATLLCLLLGYPTAWCIARARRHRALLLFLVVLPFWTSLLVRTFALIFLLRDTGLVNTLLLRIGLIDQPLTLLYTPGAVVLGLVYGLLPFMVLPIYASLEQLDPVLLDAASTLGARPLARFVTVVLPLTLPGVAAGGLLVFIPALGAFLAPDLLGGARELALGNLIQNQFTTARNWPFGAALSLALMLGVLLAVRRTLRLRDRAGTPA